ncbi:MAG: Xaa-Pro peptidase family protein, partial [Paracoccaceae bacterium]|nr:Xaa-Pro peptidase family protein [Paracoccaceae bacterium]
MDRLKQLRATMKAEGVDLVTLAPGAHMAWLLGVHPHADERPLLFCLTTANAGFLMPALEAESARQQTDLPFYKWTDADGPQAAFEKLMSDFGTGKVRSMALDECMRADHAGLVQDRLLNVNRQFFGTTVGALRMRKDADEYAKLKRNAIIADKAMQAAWAAMKPGMTENEIAQIARDSFAGQRANPLFTIIGVGGNGAFPHHQTGEEVLKTGDAIVMDIGGGIDGYSSDITRMAVMGNAPEGYAKIHTIVNTAVEAAMSVAKPGVKAHVVDDA